MCSVGHDLQSHVVRRFFNCVAKKNFVKDVTHSANQQPEEAENRQINKFHLLVSTFPRRQFRITDGSRNAVPDTWSGDGKCSVSQWRCRTRDVQHDTGGWPWARTKATGKTEVVGQIARCSARVVFSVHGSSMLVSCKCYRAFTCLPLFYYSLQL